MNRRRITIMTLAAVLLLGAAVSAQEGRPRIGVSLDASPLPELLIKHLGLKADQGIRVRNVNVASPADKAGLERDDIIIGFQERDVTDLEQFVDAVQAAGVGTEVSLDIVHLGQRKSLKFELETLPGSLEWKFPPEPEIVTSWRPGRLWRVGPDEHEWMEIPSDKIPDVDIEVKRFFNQLYTYHHSTDGEDYTITIEGDPKDENTRIVVRIDETEHSTTVGRLEALPEKYRETAQEVLEDARKSSRERIRINRIPLPRPPKPEVYRRYFQDITIPRPDFGPGLDKRERMLENLQEQMARLQQRLEQLEQGHRETLKKRPDQKQDDVDDSEATGDTPDSDGQARPMV